MFLDLQLGVVVDTFNPSSQEVRGGPKANVVDKVSSKPAPVRQTLYPEKKLVDLIQKDTDRDEGWVALEPRNLDRNVVMGLWGKNTGAHWGISTPGFQNYDDLRKTEYPL